MADLLGVDRRIDKENPEYKNIQIGIIPSNADILLRHHLLACKKGESHYYNYETQRVLDTNVHGIQNVLEQMTEEEIEQFPVRFRILLGKLKHKEKGKETKEYSNMYDKSRYQFYLDAPFEISNQCCKVMKKEPVHRYGKESGRVPMTAQMASESKLRTQQWLKHGCNAFDVKQKISNPMSFWTEQDVLLYIYTNHIPIASVYGEVVKETEVEGQLDFEDLGLFDLGVPVLKTTGCQRTGCVLCGFGAHREKAGEGRFERLKQTHPNMYKALDRATNSGVTMREAIEWTNEHGNLNIRL